LPARSYRKGSVRGNYARAIVTGKGVFEVGGDGQRFQCFIGELLRQKMGEAVAEFFAGKFSRATLKFPAKKFQAVRFRAAKALDGQRQPLLGMVRNGKHAAGDVELFRPEMKQRLFAVAAHFPRHSGKGRATAAVFADLDDAGSGELPDAGLQLGSEIHTPIIDEIRSCWNMFVKYC